MVGHDSVQFIQWQCILGILFSTAVWFVTTYLLIPERIVLNLAPSVVQNSIWLEACAARKRIAAFTKIDKLKDMTGYQSDRQFLSQLRNRCAGIVNAVICVFLSILCTVIDDGLRKDKFFGVSTSWFIAGCFVCGYFIWDIIAICQDFSSTPDSWQWLLHGIICLSALASPFFGSPVSLAYFGGLFLLLEASTPFMGARWLSLKALQLLEKGRREVGEPSNANAQTHATYHATINSLQRLVALTSIAFAVIFFIVRLLFAPIFLFLPLLHVCIRDPIASQVHVLRRLVYIVSILSFWALNALWMLRIIIAATNTH